MKKLITLKNVSKINTSEITSSNGKEYYKGEEIDRPLDNISTGDDGRLCFKNSTISEVNSGNIESLVKNVANTKSEITTLLKRL